MQFRKTLETRLKTEYPEIPSIMRKAVAWMVTKDVARCDTQEAYEKLFNSDGADTAEDIPSPEEQVEMINELFFKSAETICADLEKLQMLKEEAPKVVKTTLGNLASKKRSRVYTGKELATHFSSRKKAREKIVREHLQPQPK